MEVFPRPDHVAMWHRLAFGGKLDWDALFGGFRATVDWPSARWWREIAAQYPNAKVLLSLRDPEAWYKSMMETIYQPMKDAGARWRAGAGEDAESDGAQGDSRGDL